MEQPKVKRLSEHVIESADSKGYSQYVAQRNMMNRIKTLEGQINILLNKVAELEKKVL